MNPKHNYLVHLLWLTIVINVTAVRAGDNHNHSDHNHESAHQQHSQHKDEHSHSEIPENIAKQAGITLQPASPGKIHIFVEAYGRVSIPPDQIIHVQARFPGIVKEVRVSMGDQVKQGDTLAIIESNESLKSYSVKAAMDGTVQHRLINVGELTDEGALFTLINTQRLWAELRIFPSQRSAVSPGQHVILRTSTATQKARIDHTTPSLNNKPYIVARAYLNNTQNEFVPGEFTLANIAIDEIDAPVLVDNRAIQTFQGSSVVFVKDGDRYEPRALELGKSDKDNTEVLSGLLVGEQYVVGNSYLIKADLEKSGAAHHH